MGLTIKTRRQGEFYFISLLGRVIGLDAKKFKKKIGSILKKKFHTLIIDISQTEFIDSHGLGTLIYYHTFLQKEGRKLILYNNNPNPQSYMTRLLEITHLNDIIKIVTNLDGIEKV